MDADETQEAWFSDLNWESYKTFYLSLSYLRYKAGGII